jgi:hypothetical protein
VRAEPHLSSRPLIRIRRSAPKREGQMANLLKPSVDQMVFAHSPIARPARGRRGQEHTVRFLAQDDPREPVSKVVVARVVATLAVRVAVFALTGHI